MHDIRGPGKLGRAHPAALAAHPLKLVGRVVLQQPLGGSVRHRRKDDQIS